MPWEFPDPVTGYPLKSYCIDIPDHLAYERAFFDAILGLTRWWNWQRDEAHNAKVAADYLLAILVPQLEAQGFECGVTPVPGCEPCPIPPMSRYDDFGHLEISYDGGITYVNGDSEDPRFNGPVPDPLAGDDKECAAASNIIQFAKDARTDIADGLALSIGITAIIVILIGAGIIVVTAGSATPWVLSLAGAILGLTDAVFLEHIDDDSMDVFKCIIYCVLLTNSEPTTKFTSANYDQIIMEIDDKFSADVIQKLFFRWFVMSNGPVGLQKMSATNTYTGEPCLCDCDTPGCDFYPAAVSGTWVLNHGVDNLDGTVTYDSAGFQVEITFGSLQDISAANWQDQATAQNTGTWYVRFYDGVTLLEERILYDGTSSYFDWYLENGGAYNGADRVVMGVALTLNDGVMTARNIQVCTA